MTTARDAIAATLDQHSCSEFNTLTSQWACRCGHQLSDDTPAIEHRSHLVGELLDAMPSVGKFTKWEVRKTDDGWTAEASHPWGRESFTAPSWCEAIEHIVARGDA